MSEKREFLRRQKLQPEGPDDYKRTGEVITDTKGGQWTIIKKGTIRRIVDDEQEE